MENKNKYINVKIDEEILEILKMWNKDRKNEIKDKNLGTREPVYKVQTRDYAITHKDYSPDKTEICFDFGEDFNCFENLEEIKEYYHEDYFSSEEEYNEFMELVEESNGIYDLCDKMQDLDEDSKIKCDQVYLFYSQEVWKDQAYFLTYKEAEDYKIYQSHNLGVCRIYVDYPGYANRSTLNKFLEILDHKDIFEVIK